MESTIDFFRFREREAFIALSQGAASDAIAARRECQSASLGARAPSPALSAKREQES